MAEQTPIFDQFNLVVRDMDATVAFYRRLGVEVPDVEDGEWAPHHRTARMPSGIAIDFDSEAFARVWDPGFEGGMGVLGFRLPSREAVDEAHADLVAAGYRSQREPWDAFWGARYAVVEDPDGNAVGLMSPVDASRRTPGPLPPG
jgi:catechol 2,3-dioxygenase-like lactoylglutathione lyase family enzyme